MIKVFISLAMSNRSDEEIKNDINNAKQIIKNEVFPNINIECIDNFSCPVVEGAGRLYYLGEAIKKLDDCDYIYFCNNWKEANGCIIEYDVAKLYGKKILFESEIKNNN